MMLGMLVNTSWSGNTWKIWVDHIMKHKKDLGYKKALMVYTDGNPAATSSIKFSLPPTDVLKLKQHFEPGCEVDTVSLNGKTYIVRSRTAEQIVAFNGSKYYIICRSKRMYIVVHCEAPRAQIDGSALWLRRVVQRLIEKDF